MRLITTDELVAGDIPAQNIYNSRGVILVTQGTILTEQKVKALKNIGLQGIYIEDDMTEDIKTSMPISDALVVKTMQALSKMDIEQVIDASKQMVHELSDNLYETDMLMLKNYDDYTMQHSINVAILSTVLAKAIGMDERETEQVAQAGLLHDIGKLLVPNEIINKPSKLEPEEYEEVKKHSEYGYNQLLHRVDIWAVVRVGVLEHHENENGTGYPRGISGEEIHRIGKILHIADVYDALITKRSYKDGWSCREAMGYIRKNAGIMFDKLYAEIFASCIPLFPKGTTIKLSDGMTAVVMKNSTRNPERPIVKMPNGRVLDLMNRKDLWIVENKK